MRFVRSVHIGLVLFMLAVGAMAQVIGRTAKSVNPSARADAVSNPETYGTSCETLIAVDDSEFTPLNSSTTFAWNGGRYVTSAPNGGPGALVAGVHCPAGAAITKIVVQACNSNATSNGYVLIFAKPNTSGYGYLLTGATVAANSGCILTTATLAAPHTVDNLANSYYLEWSNNGVFDGSIKVQTVRVY